jgi:hypothetical protein
MCYAGASYNLTIFRFLGIYDSVTYYVVYIIIY